MNRRPYATHVALDGERTIYEGNACPMQIESDASRSRPCPGALELDEGSDQTRDDPEQPAMLFCPSCGEEWPIEGMRHPRRPDPPANREVRDGTPEARASRPDAKAYAIHNATRDYSHRIFAGWQCPEMVGVPGRVARCEGELEVNGNDLGCASCLEVWPIEGSAVPPKAVKVVPWTDDAAPPDDPTAGGEGPCDHCGGSQVVRTEKGPAACPACYDEGIVPSAINVARSIASGRYLRAFQTVEMLVTSHESLLRACETLLRCSLPSDASGQNMIDDARARYLRAREVAEMLSEGMGEAGPT